MNIENIRSEIDEINSKLHLIRKKKRQERKMLKRQPTIDVEANPSPIKRAMSKMSMIGYEPANIFSDFEERRRSHFFRGLGK